jgi:hypothetical protein
MGSGRVAADRGGANLTTANPKSVTLDLQAGTFLPYRQCAGGGCP